MAETLEVLLQIRDRAGGVGSRILVSTVGSLLTELGTPPRSLGVRPLTRFLGMLGPFCQLSGDYAVFGPDAPVLPKVAVHGPSTERAEAPKRPQVMNSALWTALVIHRDGVEHFLDLKEMSVIPVTLEGGLPTDPVRSEPERFVKVPPLDSDLQKEQARAALTDLVGATRAEELLATELWVSDLKTKLPPEQYEVFHEKRSVWVIEEAKKWLIRLGIPFGRLLGKRKGPRVDGDRVAILRRAITRAVTEMTESELMDLKLPARFTLPSQ